MKSVTTTGHTVKTFHIFFKATIEQTQKLNQTELKVPLLPPLRYYRHRNHLDTLCSTAVCQDDLWYPLNESWDMVVIAETAVLES
jgi:hypothetical protein